MMTEGMYSSNKDNWSTPQWLFDRLDAVFHFTLDVAANYENYKCEQWYGGLVDGLKQDWFNEVCFMNPPYGREISKWVEKAYAESSKDDTVVVGLLPARTDTKWFHEYVAVRGARIGFIKGRVSFGTYDFDGYKESPAPFPSMIVVWRVPQMTTVYVGSNSEIVIKEKYLKIPDIYWYREAI